MTPIRYDPELHRVADTPFARAMRERFRDPLLFTYHHGHTNNWMLAAWIDKPRDMMLELAVLGSHPVGDQGIVKSIESMVRTNPQGEKNRKENIRLGKTLTKHWEDQELEEAKNYAEHWEHLSRKKGKGRSKERKHWVVQ